MKFLTNMELIKDFLEDFYKLAPLGKVTTIEEMDGDLAGERVLVDNIETPIFVAYVDYIMWLEKKIKDYDSSILHS